MKKSNLFKRVIISSLLTLVVTACSVNPVSTATNTNIPANTLAGLVYHTEDGLWMIDANNQPRFLIDQPTGQLSPDGTRVAYEYQDDIWLADLITSERQNLTQTPDHVERGPQWWPARPDVIVFGSRPKGEIGISIGAPSSINVDGSNYHILDERGWGAMLSPDGQKVAYIVFENSFQIYKWESATTKVFDFTLSEWSISGLRGSAWSPDGKLLALIITGYNNNEYRVGIAIFDLETETSRLLYRYYPLGGGSYFPSLSWSPDGRWVAFTAWAENSQEIASLWLVRVDGTEQLHVGIGFNPIWSPEGDMLAYTRQVKALDEGGWIYNLNSQEQYQVSPPGTEVVGWISR